MPNPNERFTDELDLIVSDASVDIVAEGYDAGVRLGEVIDKDMIAVPVSGDIRLIVVGAPAYFARQRQPKHPRDLAQHECLNWHASKEATAYRWEFTENGRDFAMAVPSRVLTTNPSINVRLAREGAGLAMVREDRVKDDIERGALVAVLREYSTPFPGYYLYYPARRRATAGLQALVTHLRRRRRTSKNVL